MALFRSRRLIPRLTVEVLAPSVVIACVMTGIFFVTRVPPSQAEEAAGVTRSVAEETPAAASTETPSPAETAPESGTDSEPAVEDDPASPSDNVSPKPAFGAPFQLRAGVFRVFANATQLADEYVALGFTPEVVTKYTSEGDDVYYVYAAGYDTRDEARAAAARIRAEGKDVVVESGNDG